MPSSLPTREEVVRQLSGALRSLERADSPGAIHARAHAVVALTGVLAAMPEDKAEAPKGETETGDGLCGFVADDGKTCVRTVVKGQDYHAGGHWLAAPGSDPDEVRGRIARWIACGPNPDEDAPPPVPVSTERPDGETQAFHDAFLALPLPRPNEASTAESGRWEVRKKLTAVPEEDVLSFEAEYTVLDPDDSYSCASVVVFGEDPFAVASEMAAIDGVAASLPPLTDADVEKARWAYENADGGVLDGFEAALLSTGLYATPREKG